MCRSGRVFVHALLMALVITSYAAIAQGADPTPADSTTAIAYDQGRGFRLITDPSGEANFKLLTYFRYVNQKGLDWEGSDSFGRPQIVDQRHDFQLTKISMNVFGWFLDRRFRYLGYVWSANTSQGQLAQVVVAGNLTYQFSPRLTLGGGVGGLPTTRTTEGTWPNWLGVDNRLIADEYFRGSYTSGLWVMGVLPRRFQYHVMLGNNLSQFGIDAAQLDNTLNTWAGYVAWMPTTGEFGKANGFGDYERHESVATRMGVHATVSRETRQNQPSTEAIENSQIRISDGNIVFAPFLFGPGIVITDVTFKMLAADAGVKYRGLSLETEFYHRVVDDLRGPNVDLLAFRRLTDDGFQVLASALVKPWPLQVYAGTSKIFGEYGDPWEARAGMNLFPWKNKAVRWNNEVIYLDHSPVGNAGYPYPVGANGVVFSSNFEVNF